MSLRLGWFVLRGGGRIAWSTQCLRERDARIVLGRRSVIHGGGLVVALAGSEIQIGERTSVMRGAELGVSAGSTLRIGNDCYVGSFANLRVDGELRIGSSVLLGQFVSLITGEHDIRSGAGAASDLPMRRGIVAIEDGVWIGANVVVLPNVRIGSHAVVGAGSVVTRDVAPLTIVAGNPARVIGSRDPAASA